MMKGISLKNRAEMIRLSAAFIGEMGRLIGTYGCDTGELILDLSNSDIYSPLIFLKQWGRNIKTGISPERALPDDLEKLVGCDTFGVFVEYARELGRCEKRASERLSQNAAKRIEELAKRAQSEYADKGKLYCTMGLYIGALAAVILV